MFNSIQFKLDNDMSLRSHSYILSFQKGGARIALASNCNFPDMDGIDQTLNCSAILEDKEIRNSLSVLIILLC